MNSLLMPINFSHQSEWRELPPIVNESLVHKFMYWNHEIKIGMRYGVALYVLLQSYPIAERLKACDIGCEYQLKGADVCITASRTTYSVWLNLKSLHQLSQATKDPLYTTQESKSE
ncbi:MAG TPA: hypothetical protein IGS53_25890 [Leptolyngbyaceae cyanobacterium M33_DOE_097]|uniref:Uncharacterized protein n=1 Tax=Oscillatoriales cyanobacterium SpSt-418 TaxID=2282169 RepID=A0A7C3KDJ0_9CYAN|nr:hypothetical protein [Leptolyngbyaceae cyanobacterium M33_DOE_097]